MYILLVSFLSNTGKLHFFKRQIFLYQDYISLSRLRDKTDFPKNQCGVWVFNFQKRSGKVLLLGGQQRKMHKFTLAKVTHLACSIWLQQEPCTEIGVLHLLQRFTYLHHYSASLAHLETRANKRRGTLMFPWFPCQDFPHYNTQH